MRRRFDLTPDPPNTTTRCECGRSKPRALEACPDCLRRDGRTVAEADVIWYLRGSGPSTLESVATALGKSERRTLDTLHSLARRGIVVYREIDVGSSIATARYRRRKKKRGPTQGRNDCEGLTRYWDLRRHECSDRDGRALDLEVPLHRELLVTDLGPAAWFGRAYGIGNDSERRQSIAAAQMLR